MDDHIFHLGIVDRALSLAAPGVLCGGVAVVNAHQIDALEIEFEAVGVQGRRVERVPLA